MRLNPLTVRKLRRFRSLSRGFWSAVILAGLFAFSLLGELFVSHRALLVKYQGHYYFPTYGANFPGTAFGLGYGYETNYRDLQAKLAAEGRGDWVLLPAVAYNPYENSPYQGVFKPAPPSFLGGPRGHWLGTDTTGRDILARLFYGFRVALCFALAFVVLTYTFGITIGCTMGYFGGAFDIVGQRIIEIWSNIPFLYMVIIISSVIPSALGTGMRITLLLLVLVLFSWTELSYYMRSTTYREKSRDYTAAALVLGAGTPRIIFHHILPNTLSTVLTFVPFTVSAAITSITALDFLGFGLPEPTPSLGELLKQGTETLTTAPWIVTSAFVALVLILTLVTFIGEAVREAFDPRRFTTYL